MATDKPRFSVTMSEDMYEKINKYQHENRLSTQTKAISKILEIGLESLQNKLAQNTTSDIETALPELSDEAKKIAKDYEGLDRHGRNMTKIVITEERKRHPHHSALLYSRRCRHGLSRCWRGF